VTFKDHFSKQAADYAKFRPRYPQELFDHLGKIAPSRQLAWDCGTGNGQAAVGIASVFDHVIATIREGKVISINVRGAAREECSVVVRLSFFLNGDLGCFNYGENVVTFFQLHPLKGTSRDDRRYRSSSSVDYDFGHDPVQNNLLNRPRQAVSNARAHSF
jgi:hypothetical protein